MSKIYLISPPQIDDLQDFTKSLDDILSLNLIPVFQLRLKGYELSEITNIAKELLAICQKHNVLFILNDYADLAIKIGAGGVHVGVDDENIMNIKKKSPEGFVVGASCYDSKDLAMIAAEQGADYISFGAFFESPTKKSRGKPDPEIIKWSDELFNIPTVAIGGITDENCSALVDMGAEFLAVISYVWSSDNKKDSIEKLLKKIN